MGHKHHDNKPKSRKGMSRRRFLGSAACAAVGSTTFLSSFTSLGMMNSLAAPRPILGPPPPDDYKALVCILLAGGNDSFNMVVPTTSEPYADYALSRTNLALTTGELLPLNYTDSLGINYGIHPAMPEVANMFNDGSAAILANIGTLLEPVTKTQILNEFRVSPF